MSNVDVEQVWACAVCIVAEQSMNVRTTNPVEIAQKRNGCFITIPPLTQKRFWIPKPLRLRRGPGDGGGDHRVDDGSRVSRVGADGGGRGAIRALRGES